MGYDNEQSAQNIVTIDIETAPLLDAATYLDPVTAAKNLKDPVKIATDIEERTREQADKCALDWNVGRIVAVGIGHEIGSIGRQIEARIVTTEDDESDALRDVWRRVTPARGQAPPTVLGFRIREFDLPFLIQRSRYLGVRAPSFDLGRYARGGHVVDLYDLLTFQDSQRTFAMRRSLHAFARRFGLPYDDAVTGADVPALIAAGDHSAVLAHVREDVRLTEALAVRLGVLAEETAAVL